MDLNRNILLELDACCDYDNYLILVRPFLETLNVEKYKILILSKYLFIENFVYAEIVNGTLDEKYQEKLIFDKLLTTLRWGTTFAASGFVVNSTSCNDKLKSTTPTVTFINDGIVSFTRTTENVNEDIF